MYSELIERIQLLIERKRFDDAQIRISEALAQFPDSGYLYALQASVYEQKDENDKALSVINTAIGLDPDADFLHYVKSRVLIKMKKPKEAMAAIDEALRLDSHDPEYFGQKAMIYYVLEKREDAINWARQGKEMDPENVLCSNVLSLALGSLGKTDEAEQVLGSMLELDPDNALNLTSMGYNYLRKGNIQKAKDHFASALMIDPEFEYARDGMIEAMKASNFFYRKILQYQALMERLGTGKQWVFIIGLIIVVKLVPFLFPFYMVFLLWIWFAPPISDSVLYFDKQGRFLMSEKLRQVAMVNIGLLATAFFSAAILLPTIGANGIALSFGCFLAIIPIHRYAHIILPKNKVVMGLFAATFLISGIAETVMAAMGISNGTAWTVLIFSGVAFSWVASAFND